MTLAERCYEVVARWPTSAAIQLPDNGRNMPLRCRNLSRCKQDVDAASKVYLHYLETRKFHFCFRRKHFKHKRRRWRRRWHTHSCSTCVSQTAPKPEVESAAHLVLVRIYIWSDSGGCRFQSLQTGRLAAEETTTAGHLTQLWVLTVWRHQDMFRWRTGGGSAAVPEPPSLDRCCTLDESEPGATKDEKTIHAINYYNSLSPVLSNHRGHVWRGFFHRCDETSYGLYCNLLLASIRGQME